MYGLSIGSSVRSPISGEYPADWDLGFHVQFGIMRQLFPWKVTVQLNAYLYNPPVSLPTLSDIANKGRFAVKPLLPHGPQKLNGMAAVTAKLPLFEISDSAGGIRKRKAVLWQMRPLFENIL